MSRFARLIGVLGATGLAAVSIGAGTASAASHPRTETLADWQASIARLPQPGAGCYQASFPTLRWHAVRCGTAREMPLAPSAATLRGGPDKLGNGKDYSAVVTGLISGATGTFAGVSSNISESGTIGGVGARHPNEYTLQLNTQFFTGSPACAKAATPSKCLAWQQFVYESDNNQIFMQYWLINYATTCPAGWFTYSTDCYTNSASATLGGGRITAKELASVSLRARAASGGNDSVSVAVGSRRATIVSAKDTKVDLAAFWNTTEWGVFGDGGGSEAFFGASNALTAVTTLTASGTGAPTCALKGYTGETNNLTLASTPVLDPGPSPTMASRQTNHDPGTASCSAVS